MILTSPLSRGFFIVLYNRHIAYVDTVNPLATGLLGSLPIAAFNSRELRRTKPFDKSTAPVMEDLGQAMHKRIEKIAPGTPTVPVDLELVKSDSNKPMDMFQDPTPMASNARLLNDKGEQAGYRVYMNPNADSAYFAHELGHIASDQTDIGRMFRSLRSNPKLSAALTGAMFTLPGITSALEAGDDDADTAIAIALAASSPALVDEALATKNALAMMESSGQRATLGQRGKLAGGYLSYLANPILMGLMGNQFGNFIDEDK